MYVVITYQEFLKIVYIAILEWTLTDRRRGHLGWTALMWRTREEWSKETR